MAQIPAATGTYRDPRSTILGGNSTTENSISIGGVRLGGTKTSLSQKTVIQSAFKGSAVTITSVADEGGLCRFTLNSHTLVVGDYIMVSGASAKGLNRVHKVLAKDTNTFDTNVTYATSATAGSYQLVSGNLNVLTEGNFIGPLIGTTLAGLSKTAFQSASLKSFYRGIAKIENGRRLNITSWSYTTGRPTYGGNEGASYNYHKALNETNIDNAANPSMTVPGTMVTMFGNNIPVYYDYSAITG